MSPVEPNGVLAVPSAERRTGDGWPAFATWTWPDERSKTVQMSVTKSCPRLWAASSSFRPCEDGLRLRVLAGERPEQGHRDRHEERGRDSLARDVADGEEEAVGSSPEGQVEVAAHVLGGLEDGVEVEVGPFGAGRQVGREEPELDLARDREVALQRRFHSVRVGLGLEERPDARLHLEDLERLRQVVVRPELESLRLVGHVLQGGEEHDGEVARRGIGPEPPQNLVAVEARHDDVEEDDVGLDSPPRP